MKERALAAILLAVAALQLVTPSVTGFAVPDSQSAIGIAKSAIIFAWSVTALSSIALAAYLLLRKVHYAGILVPLISTFSLAIVTLIADAQQWWWVSFVLTSGMLALLWRTFYVLTKHRDQVTRLGQLLVTTPVAIYAGWITVVMLTRLADAMWNSGVPRTGTLATSWQAIIIIVIVLAAGFGIEASRAHIAFAATLVWALVQVVIAAGQAEQGVLTGASLFATLIVVTLFFIERAMFRGPRARRAVH